MIDKPIEGLSAVVESSQVEERTLRGFAITQIYMEENYALVIEQDPPVPDVLTASAFSVPSPSRPRAS